MHINLLYLKKLKWKFIQEKKEHAIVYSKYNQYHRDLRRDNRERDAFIDDSKEKELFSNKI